MPTETVRVVVRSRPLSNSEESRGNFSILTFDKEIRQINIKDPKSGLFKSFAYDSVYPIESTQQELYDESAYPLVESSLQGYNSTIFAYGQTGCGKTFTMLGVPSSLELRGVIPNSFAHIFGCISEATSKIFLVKCSYIEIYNEEIRDLLNYNKNQKLELKEAPDKGTYIKGLSMHDVKSPHDITSVMETGNTHRIVKETAMNDKSSRSHAVFIIYVESSENAMGRHLIRAGKLNLVDLAGSERQKKTGAEGDRLKEAIKINLSLSALGNVINALVEKSSHVPYRDSKLTLLLQDSLGGNTKTLMIAVVSPADYNYEETISTLRYASRAKFIQNKPKINEDPKDAMLRDYLNEIQRLKALLSSDKPAVIEKIVEKIITVEKLENDSDNQLGVSKDNRVLDQEGVSKTNRVLNQEGVDMKDSNEDKTKLETMIKEIQEKIVIGGEELDKVEQDRLKAQKKFRNKLKKQKKKEKQLIEEKQKKEEEFLNINKMYRDGQEESDHLRAMIKTLRGKYKNIMSEIEHLNHDFEDQREEIYEDLRTQSKENEFLLGIIEKTFPLSELENIKLRSSYQEINHSWTIPEFYLELKKSFFPNISEGKSSEIKYENSAKKISPSVLSYDQSDYLKPKGSDKKQSIKSNAYRDFREEVKSEMRMYHSELPSVNRINKKMIADGFTLKKLNLNY